MTSQVGKQLRVLQCYAGNLYGGIERQLAMFARFRRDDNPLGRSFALCFLGRLSEELAASEAEVHWVGEVKLSRPWTVLRARWKLGRILRDCRYDLGLCHAMWPHLVFGPTIKWAKMPLCVWAHDTPEKIHWIDRLALRTKPDLVIANSNFTRDYWHRNHPSVHCQTFYYPLPRPEHGDIELTRVNKRRELSTPADSVVILIAARFEEWKGHRLLLEALEKLKSETTWRCWIAGGAQRPVDVDRVESLKVLASKAGIADRVQWLGSRSDVFDLMLASDIYCQPNLGPEPFGVVFVEAMHAELPIVTSDIGGPTEFIDNSCGRLVHPKDLNALSITLLQLLGDPALRRKLGAAGRTRAEKLFSLEPNLRSLNEMLVTVLAKHRDKLWKNS